MAIIGTRTSNQMSNKFSMTSERCSWTNHLFKLSIFLDICIFQRRKWDIQSTALELWQSNMQNRKKKTQKSNTCESIKQMMNTHNRQPCCTPNQVVNKRTHQSIKLCNKLLMWRRMGNFRQLWALGAVIMQCRKALPHQILSSNMCINTLHSTLFY